MQTCLDAMEIEQQAAGMVDPERPMTGESTLPSSDVPEETITHKANDEGVASVISEATDSGLSAQGLTLEVMLERVLLLEPLIIDTLQEESMFKNREIESDEASARITIDSHSPSTKSSTGIGDFTIARSGPVLGQARDSINDRTSAAAHATFQSSETNVQWAGVSSIASDGPLVIDSDVSEEKLSVKFGCERPLACTTSEGQEECEKGAIIPPVDVQSMFIDLAQSNIEQKQSTPNLMPDVGGDERPGDRTMLENTGSADSASVEVGTTNTTTSSPPVRSRPARISRSFPAEDKHDHSNSTLFDSVDQAPSKIDKGQLGYAAGGVYDFPRTRHKLPATKRKRVARSEKNASGTSTYHPLPRVAVCSQNKPKVFASKYTQQRPDANTKVQPTHRSQALELLQSSISEVRAQCHGQMDHHSHEPQQFDNNTEGSTSLASQNPRDEGTKEKRVNLDRGVETPSTQHDKNISKAKGNRIEARTRVANRPGEGSNDSTKQIAKRSRAKVSIAMNCDHESGPISTSGGGLVASTGSDADVQSLRFCTKTNTETYTRDESNAGSLFGDADGSGNERAAKTPQAWSTDAKEGLPGKRQHHTEQIPAPIEHVDGSGDGRSKAILEEYEGSAGEMVRESEVVLAGSYPTSQNSLFPSSRHQQLLSTINDLHNPNFSRTDSEIHPSNKVPATTKSAQAPQRRRRANKTSTTSGHQTSVRGSMSTSRGSIPGVRGQSRVRSSNQDDHDAPIPWPSRAPSVASNSAPRRPRGFQPAEVGRSKSNINTGVTSPAPPKAEAPDKPRESATIPKSSSLTDVEVASSARPQAEAVTQSHSSASLKSQPGIEALSKINQAKVGVEAEGLTTALLAQTSQKQNEVIAELLAKARTPRIPSDHQGKAARPNGSSNSTPIVQTVTIPLPLDPSRPELDPVQIGSSGERSTSEASSIPIITHNEPKQSCWSRAVTTVTAPPAKAKWDNSDNPIDHPAWRRASTLPSPDYKGPVVANFRNLPPYKLIGVKKAEGTWPSGSFGRQMANIQQTLQSSQPFMEVPNAHLTTPKRPIKVPPHLRAQGTSPIAGASMVNHAGKGEADNRPPHLRHPTSPSKANNEDDDSKTGEASNAVMKNYTPPPHLQRPSIENRLPMYHSPFPASPSHHPVEAASPSKIDFDEELAAELAVDIEKDAQVAAAVAAGDPQDDQQFAAGLQTRFDNEQFAAKPQQMGKVESDARVDTRPPHLRASQQKHEAPAVVARPQHQLPAAIQPSPILQDPYTNAIASHAGALKDVTQSRQNAKVTSPLEGIALPNEVESAVKKGKKPANELNPGNGVSDLVGWDGKMTPALLGEDWEVRAQHNRHGQEKLAVIQTWTQDHAVDPEAGLVRAEDRLMSPISIKHPVTKPSPDEFNQAKRHLNTNDHIQAYKVKHSSSVDNTTPSSRGRMSKEEKREARKRYAEEERNRVYPPNEHAPAANIYLRPAEFKDMRQVSFLHNHYVLKTACAHDLEETNELYWRQRLQETIDENDPFLVAVHMGSKPINNLRDVHRKKSETIVGFAFAADYGLQTHAYRFTVELEMWVHQDHLHQGIGRSMLDRMLAALDPGYNLLECAPFLCGEMLSRWVSGSHCLVKTILVNLLHNEDDKKDVEWKKDWLSNKNDFKYCGTLPGMGHKFGKDVDIAQMILRTSAAMPPSPIS